MSMQIMEWSPKDRSGTKMLYLTLRDRLRKNEYDFSTIRSSMLIDSLTNLAQVFLQVFNLVETRPEIFPRKLKRDQCFMWNALNNFVSSTDLGTNEMLSCNNTNADIDICDSWQVLSPLQGQVFTDSVKVSYDLRQLFLYGFLYDKEIRRSTEFNNVISFSDRSILNSFQVCFRITAHNFEYNDILSGCDPRSNLDLLVDAGWYTVSFQLFSLPHFVAVCKPRLVNFCVGSVEECTALESQGMGTLPITRNDDLDAKMSNIVNNKNKPVISSVTDVSQSRIYLQERGLGEGVCFFTMVLNGMPFLDYQLQTFQKFGRMLASELFPGQEVGNDLWDWYIVEGVAAGRANHKSPYSAESIPNRFHNGYLSVDGTTEYLDAMAQANRNIHIFRKCRGPSNDKDCMWIDKIQMANVVAEAITSSCLMVEVDVDELWTAEQLLNLYSMFYQPESDQNQQKHCAYFSCHFFVGKDLVTTTINGYGHSQSYEWLRAWRWTPDMFWLSHAPPMAMKRIGMSLAALTDSMCYSHDETRKRGLVFSHYAYATENQVDFKSSFYGYGDIVDSWKAMQEAERPVKISKFLPWLRENHRFLHTLADDVYRTPLYSEIKPVPFPGESSATTCVSKNVTPLLNAIRETSHSSTCIFKVVIDTVEFTGRATQVKGIVRVWLSLIPELLRVMKSINGCLLLLWRSDNYINVLNDLDDTEAASLLDYLNHRVIPPNRRLLGISDDVFDSILLSSMCREYQADAFISTKYTVPDKRFMGTNSTKVLLLVHDFVPEALGWDMSIWTSKVRALHQADSLISVSEATANDFQKFYPQLALDKEIVVSRNGVDTEVFQRASPESILDFRNRWNIIGPYILFVGARGGYKQGANLVAALRSMNSPPLLIFIGGLAYLEPDISSQIIDIEHIHIRALSDVELAIAYSGAIALLYLSIAEGFGLPLIEAMACGCPIIISPTSEAVLEVAGLVPRLDSSSSVPPMQQRLKDGICLVPAVATGMHGSAYLKGISECIKRASDLTKSQISVIGMEFKSYVREYYHGWMPLAKAIVGTGFNNFLGMKS